MRLSEKVTAATLLVIAILVGMSWIGTPAKDEELDAAAEASARLLPIIRATRERYDSIARVKDSLQKVAQRASARAILATSSITIDTTLPRPKLMTDTSLDTVRMGWVTRRDDTTHYPVPLFFVEVYEATKQAWLDERRLRIYDSTYTIPLKDTLNLQLWELTKSRGREVELWKQRSRRDRVRAYVVGGVTGVALYALLRR